MRDDFDKLLDACMESPEFKKEYDAREPEFNVIQTMITARKTSNLTQKELAQKTGIHQADISKLESGNANPTLAILKRLAEGMDMKLKLEFIPKTEIGVNVKETRDYLEVNLPPYLKEDIENLVEGRKNNHFALDGLYNEVQSSINVAFYDKRIDEEQANYLRKKYL